MYVYHTRTHNDNVLVKLLHLYACIAKILTRYYPNPKEMKTLVHYPYTQIVLILGIRSQVFFKCNHERKFFVYTTNWLANRMLLGDKCMTKHKANKKL